MHKMQSELGTTGDCSPNIDLINKVTEMLNQNFDHTHETITGSDCFFFLTGFNAGKRIGEEEDSMASMFGSIGCEGDLIYCFAQLLQQEPRWIDVFMQAIMVAKMGDKI